jgi:membrane protein DedA with SNARE-associated domain
MHWMHPWEHYGVLVGMFLESCVLPIPSEVVIVSALAVHISVFDIVWLGTLGSTLGALVGYAIGRYGARPLLLKFGKWIWISPDNLAQAEAFVSRYGVRGIFIGRILPFAPFKIFSITAGATRMSPIPFVLMTFFGVIPRMIFLVFFGWQLIQNTIPCLVLCVLLLIYVVAKHKLIGKKT